MPTNITTTNIFLRFNLVNLVGFVGVYLAYVYGFIHQIWEADPTRITVVICGLFISGLCVAGHKAWKIDRELGNPVIRTGEKNPTAIRMRHMARIFFVRQLANLLVVLGLIGTVVGFIIALSGVSPDTVGDVTAIGPMVSTLIQGMGVAFYTTLVGSILYVWMIFIYNILATGAAKLISAQIGDA